MGKFDGYLICSDVDGTFHMGDTIGINSEAVRYFTARGGRFTFATGRTVEYLLRPDLNSVINAPACLLNGGVVYDYQNRKLLWQRRLAYTLGEFAAMVLPVADAVRQFYVHDSPVEGARILKDLSEIDASLEEIRCLKIICTFDTPEQADRFRDAARQLPLAARSYISKSWGLGVEFNASEGTKGHGLDFIREYLGNIHTAIGIGDYENDIPLLTHADIGVAVGNAQPAVKAAADRVVCGADRYALRDLIEQLDGELP